MNKNRKNLTLLIIVAVFVVSCVGAYFYYEYSKINQLPGNFGISLLSGTNNLKTYINSRYGFEFDYSKDFELSEGGLYPSLWVYYSAEEGEKIVTVNIPRAQFENTNLAEANVDIGASRDPKSIKDCLNPGQAGYEKESAGTTINNIAFRRFDSSGVGVGNYYETQSYRTVRDNICYAVELTIHSTNIQNYDPKMGIKEFDRTSITKQLNAILNSFSFIPIDPNSAKQSGLIGKVILGPTCPVVKPDSEGQCSDKPYAATISISMKTNGGVKQVGTAQSDNDGNFKILLDPGTYTIVGVSNPKSIFPVARPEEVTVKAGEFTSTVVYFDTGIR